jgi:hypothetical protein
MYIEATAGRLRGQSLLAQLVERSAFKENLSTMQKVDRNVQGSSP